MAQISRIAASTTNRMTSSTTSIGSAHSDSRIVSASGDGLLSGEPRENNGFTHNSRTGSSSSEDNTNGSQRFWFPSVTSWYSELNKAHAVTILVLCYCNLINYMDRSTVAGMINFIRDDPSFNVKSDKTLGLLQVNTA